MMKRYLRILLGSFLAIGLISTSVVNTSFAADPKNTTLSLWVNSADTKQLGDLYKRFTAVTGYKLKITSFPSDGFEKAVLQRWSAGDRPDILEWHGNFNWVAAVNPKVNMQDLSKFQFVNKTQGGILKSNASIDGKVYGAILNTPTSFGLFFNKEFFQAKNISVPTTSAELLSSCLAIKKADPSVVPLQESGGSMWTPLVFHGAFMADSLQKGFLQDIIKRKSKVSDSNSPWLGALKFYKSLQTAGCFNSDITTAKFETSPKQLLDGKVAMVSMHSGFIQMAIDASNLETVNKVVGWTPWSDTRPVVTSETSPIGTYYIPKTGKKVNEEGAKRFINFITGVGYAPYIKASNQVPTISGVAIPSSLPVAWKSIQAAVAKNGSVPPIWSLLPGITDLVNYPGQVITGELSPQAAVDLLQKQAEQGAKAAGLPAWK